MKISSIAASLAAIGVVCIFGGEALCITGPIEYERQIHLACHAILYSGIGCVAVAGLLHWKKGKA